MTLKRPKTSINSHHFHYEAVFYEVLIKTSCRSVLLHPLYSVPIYPAFIHYAYSNYRFLFNLVCVLSSSQTFLSLNLSLKIKCSNKPIESRTTGLCNPALPQSRIVLPHREQSGLTQSDQTYAAPNPGVQFKLRQGTAPHPVPVAHLQLSR
uniref:Ovule protein n=1 Tax=Syphacia muris TaxID=451379 RepID=A0A0N5AJV8_9BILA